MTASRLVLCLAPHPDDESIGCGGTLAQHAAAGDDIRLVWVTSGERGGQAVTPAALAALREDEARAAAAALGGVAERFLRMPDGRLRAHEQRLVEAVAALLDELTPAVVYAPHLDDGHDDHAVVAHAVRTALPVVDGAIDQVWGYEVWTPIARPTWLNGIDEHLDTKLTAVRAHRSQLALIPFDDAARGLARYRGALHCWPYGSHAEAFKDLKP